MRTDKKKINKFIIDCIFVLVGGFIWAVGLNMFIVVNEIAPSGVTGIAAVINHFTGWPIGVMTILMNIPVFFISWKGIGIKFALSSTVAMFVTSVIIDVTALFLPVYTGNQLLAALYGGVLSGIGLGMVYMRGIATGGVDSIARVLEKHFPFISYGTLIIILDVIVIAGATVAYGKIEVALYSVIVVYLSGVINDKLLIGLDRGKMVYIISEQSQDEIADAVMKKSGRGVTEMRVRGAYTSHEKNMLMVVCRPYEIFRIKSVVKFIDPRAFIIVSDVTEVVGEGFKEEGGTENGT